MDLIYEEVIPSPVDNTKVEKIYSDNKHIGFRLTPNKNYVLHDSNADIVTPEKEYIPFFCKGDTTVKNDYDFDNIVEDVYEYTDENSKKNTLPVAMIGKFGFYALPCEIVPKEQLY